MKVVFVEGKQQKNELFFCRDKLFNVNKKWK